MMDGNGNAVDIFTYASGFNNAYLLFGCIGRFSMKKVKTLNFSGSFVACDLKVGRYRQHVELMKCCEY